MKRAISCLGILILASWMVSCETNQPLQVTSPDVVGQMELTDNQRVGEIPAATVALRPVSAFADATALQKMGEDPTLTPSELIATLAAGECISEEKLLHLPADVAPPRGDVMFVFDLTGSMVGELENVKVNSINIMNEIRTLIPDTQFGVISHMDYNGTFGGCGYGPTSYGEGGDYPYSLDQPLTADIDAVAAAINGLVLGFGDDGPEDYTRPLYELYADAGVGLRMGSKRIALLWQDNVPHDCDYTLDCGGSGSTGPDPGRDATVGTMDDLELAVVLDGLNDHNITLIGLHSGGSLALWDCYAGKTGGASFQINSNGTVPDGSDIEDFVAGLVQEEIGTIDELTLEVCTAGFEDWLVSVDPVSYTDLMLDEPLDLPFTIEICVPEETMDGDYAFQVCAIGDGVEFAYQDVLIEVRNEVEVPVDVKPTSCPNPINGGGVLPVAILGWDELDVMVIDPSTVRLEGVAPIRWEYDDVATPFMPFTGKEDCVMDCNEYGPDGIMDLTVMFEKSEILAALGVDGERGMQAVVSSGAATERLVEPTWECRVVTLTGEMYSGRVIVGEDVVRIKLE
jgi:hypothetical protein